MKINKNTGALYALLIFSLVDGIIGESISLFSLLYLYLSERENKNKIKCFYILILVAWGVIVLLQLFYLDNGTFQLIRIFGITKCICAPIIVILCMRQYIIRENVIEQLMPFVIAINIIYSFYIFTKNENFNIIHGSENYMGAIDLLFLIYSYKFLKSKTFILKYMFWGLYTLLLIFSGSRTFMLLTAFEFLIIFYTEKRGVKRLSYITILMALSCILFTIGGSNIGYMLSRALSVFTDRSDAARSGLIEFAKRQFNSYSNIQKWIGGGDVLVLSQNKPVHNSLGEILLCYGYCGLTVFVSSWCIGFIKCLITRNNTRLETLAMITVIFTIGMVQPFLTTGFLFQILATIVVTKIFYYRETSNG